VYMPLASMVPSVVFPPATPLMDQLTAGLEPSPVFAVNCCCVTPGMTAPDGVTVNAVSPAPPAPAPGRIALAHPLRNTSGATSITSAERFTASSPVCSQPAGQIPTPAPSIAPDVLWLQRDWVAREYGARSFDTTGRAARFGATVLLSCKAGSYFYICLVCSLAKACTVSVSIKRRGQFEIEKRSCCFARRPRAAL